MQRSIHSLLFGVLLAGAITHGCGRSNGGKGTDQYTINEAFGDYQIHFFQTDEGKEFGITDTLEETLTKQGQTTKIVYEDGTGRSRLDGKVDRVTITYPDERTEIFSRGPVGNAVLTDAQLKYDIWLTEIATRKQSRATTAINQSPPTTP